MHQRSRMVLGDDALLHLQNKHVIVFGLGGVGGHAAEALCRGGIGEITLVDFEAFEETNLNRQLFATRKTLGLPKTEAAKVRLLEISPSCRIHCVNLFFTEETEPAGLFDGVNYILDAIDTVSSKLHLIRRGKELGIPVISSMGTGNKTDPTAFRVADLFQTKGCPLARAMRNQCRKNGLGSCKVVYSEEEPVKTTLQTDSGHRAPGSVSFVPGVAGMILAGEIIKDLVKECLSSEPIN
ncbi:MAG: tRNA threonylcarbamoyladenosine dehydratase [Clostridia bacterium]|nr:tRNA threonylcarbamoyladenosine dehydratase [Clostridia bacterium]